MKKHRIQGKKISPSDIFHKIVFLLLSAGFLFPLYWMVCLSFKSESEASARPFSLPSTFTLDNFKTVFERINLGQGMINSFLYAAVVSTLVCLFSAMAAYAIFRMGKHSSSAIYRYFVMGLAVPGMCLVVPVYMILKFLGLIGTFWAVVIPCVTGNVCASVLFIGAFIKSIPYELEEAAALDGCSPSRCFFSIMLPMLKSGITTKFTLLFLTMWNEYSSFKIFCLGRSRQPITLMINSFFNTKYAVHWGQVGAAILLSSAPAIIIYCICNKQLAKALTFGSISK